MRSAPAAAAVGVVVAFLVSTVAGGALLTGASGAGAGSAIAVNVVTGLLAAGAAGTVLRTGQSRPAVFGIVSGIGPLVLAVLTLALQLTAGADGGQVTTGLLSWAVGGSLGAWLAWRMSARSPQGSSRANPYVGGR